MHNAFVIRHTHTHTYIVFTVSLCHELCFFIWLLNNYCLPKILQHPFFISGYIMIEKIQHTLRFFLYVSTRFFAQCGISQPNKYFWCIYALVNLNFNWDLLICMFAAMISSFIFTGLLDLKLFLISFILQFFKTLHNIYECLMNHITIKNVCGCYFIKINVVLIVYVVKILPLKIWFPIFFKYWNV